jgi:hypothetical protein
MANLTILHHLHRSVKNQCARALICQ